VAPGDDDTLAAADPLSFHRRPSLVLSVTGGALSFNLPPLLENAISSGLQRVRGQRTKNDKTKK
jgi:hypothetical protein